MYHTFIFSSAACAVCFRVSKSATCVVSSSTLLQTKGKMITSKLKMRFSKSAISPLKQTQSAGVYIQMYSNKRPSLPKIEPGSPACQPAALTTRPNPRPSMDYNHAPKNNAIGETEGRYIHT
jgi:hypothetical protein